MPNFTITSFSTTDRSLTGGELGVVTKDGELVVTDAAPVTMTGNSANYVSVNGTIQAISTVTYSAFDMSGYGGYFRFGQDATITSVTGRGIFGQVTDVFSLDNAGTILGGTAGISVNETDGAIIGSISNSGTIQSSAVGIYLATGSTTARIVNTGTIIGTNNDGILVNSLHGGGSVINNSGSVFGSNNAFRSGDGPDIIYNSGTFHGRVDLDGGDDRYDGGAGIVTREIDGELGNDTIAGGDVADTMMGGEDDDLLVGRGGDDSMNGEDGNDTLFGGDGNDSMDGGLDDDVLTGNSGDDTVTGGAGNDLIVGQAGSDLLVGGRQDDTIDGGAGDDNLEGNSGNDILRGRSGEDELAGGEGRDFLTGGQDADAFVFRAFFESVPGANRDQILDFEQGLDLIIVSGLTPGVFEFRGTAAFSPSGNPELRLFETPTGSTIVQLDTNGDGSIDSEIRVANVTGLTADDFVL